MTAGTDSLSRTCLSIGLLHLDGTLDKAFVLHRADFAVESASIGHGRSGATFRCTLNRVTDETLEALEDAARAKRKIRFAFPKHPLVLGSTAVARIGPGRIRIAGRVVKPD